MKPASADLRLGFDDPLAVARPMLRPHEAAAVLQIPEAEVVRMIARGALRDVSPDHWRRLDVEDVQLRAREAVAHRELGPLSLLVLRELALGRLVLRRPKRRGDPPPTPGELLFPAHGSSHLAG